MHQLIGVPYNARMVTYLAPQTAAKIRELPEDDSVFIREAVRRELQRREITIEEDNA